MIIYTGREIYDILYNNSQNEFNFMGLIIYPILKRKYFSKGNSLNFNKKYIIRFYDYKDNDNNQRKSAKIERLTLY